MTKDTTTAPKKSNKLKAKQGKKKIKSAKNLLSTKNDPSVTKKIRPTQTASSYRLKEVRGTPASTAPPPAWSRLNEWQDENSKRFLTPDDGSYFSGCLDECYRGLHWDEAEAIPPAVHSEFSSAFRDLEVANLFQYDAIVAGGKQVSNTFVTRTLVGVPGSTYRYLGLRLFSHPWCDVVDGKSSDGNGKKERGRSLERLGYGRETCLALLGIGAANRYLSKTSTKILSKSVVPHVPEGLVGSAEFSITLINRMEPTSHKKDLKPETQYGMGKTSVSWHKDSGLQDFSTIAVYHTLIDPPSKPSTITTNAEPWRVALRISADSNGNANKTPPLSVPLPSGTAYYLLDDFNHKHEHAVIAGSDLLRYSSTHRVAKDTRDTWDYIRDKCKTVTHDTIANNAKLNHADHKKATVKQIRAQQMLLTEIEFEWLRQWYVQGQLHARLHLYWHRPMKYLESSFQTLYNKSQSVIKRLKAASVGTKSQDTSADGEDDRITVTEDLFDVMIESITERIRMRNIWELRLKDGAYSSMTPDKQPMSIAVLKDEDLSKLLKNLRLWRELFVDRLSGNDDQATTPSLTNDKKKKKSDKKSGYTRKEQKKVASNWNSLKSKIGQKR